MKTNHAWIALLTLAACTSRSEPTSSSADASVGRSVSTGAKPAAPQSKQPAPENVLQTSFDYYDGDEKRTVWVSNDLVAEFAPSDVGKDAVMRADAQAKEEPQTAQKDVRLWRVRAPRGTEAFAREASTGATRLSPVVHDAASGGRPIRALPGGVVATFPKDWDRARVDAWLAPRKLKIDTEVVEGGNVYLIATAPGIDSIRVANELYSTHELVAATPNFWMQVTTR